jgi:hypothetical protein
MAKIQISIISVLGLATAILAFTANILRNGWLTAIASAVIILIILILTVQQIRCVIFGRCYFTSWFNTFVGSSLLGSIGLYYLLALMGRVPLPGIESQPIAAANPNIKYVTDTLKNRLNFDVYTYVSGSTLGRTSSQGASSSVVSPGQ